MPRRRPIAPLEPVGVVHGLEELSAQAPGVHRRVHALGLPPRVAEAHRPRPSLPRSSPRAPSPPPTMMRKALLAVAAHTMVMMTTMMMPAEAVPSEQPQCEQFRLTPFQGLLDYAKTEWPSSFVATCPGVICYEAIFSALPEQLAVAIYR